MLGLNGCVTRYQHSNVDIQPSYVSGETIEWCVDKKCPDYVKHDLMMCQASAMKQEFRNDQDSTVVKEDVGDKGISGFMTLWDWL